MKPAAIAIGLLVAVICDAALAARPTPRDRAWIDTCIAQRKNENFARSKASRFSLRQLCHYCTCMHDAVEDNQPLTISELEHSYPPAHLNCQRGSR